MNYTERFDIWFIAITASWMVGLILILLPLSKKIKIAGNTLLGLGFILLLSFVSLLWMRIDRPPMKTIGEIRLWFSIFLAVLGYYLYWRKHQIWLLIPNIIGAALFLFVTYRHPENFDKHLAPVLHGPWFIPHILVYMMSYALLFAASVAACKGLITLLFKRYKPETIALVDNLVFTGFAFLTSGLLFGALWAKQAWGHYWTWDPKEIWSAITWFTYLVYVHLRYSHPEKRILPLCYICLALLVLFFGWMGLNYLPSAGVSYHNF
jgi:ABC-type transport system involved in cytochrome c biogenesis permease subunit